LSALAALVAALVLAGCGSTATATDTATATPGLAVAPSALALQQQFVQVVKQVGPAVVLIRTSEGLGSGIVFDANGDVVTNNHVVDNAGGFRVTLANGKQYRASLVGTFPADDLAVLHVDATRLRPAAFADSSKLASATSRWRSVTRWACRAASPKGSSAPSGAPSTRTTASRCPTSSRPARRSTPATPAARWSTSRVRSSAFPPWPPPTPSSAPARRQASALRSPATPCATSPPSSSAAGR
jgi:S1-C subfamily serine protease